MTLDPLVITLRRFAVDFLTGHHPEVCREIMTADYTLTIGGLVLRGRDEAYVPATAGQLALFPGLCITVHDVLVGDGRAALRFTEHGGSTRHDGAAAAWGGIALFRYEQDRFAVGFAEEDYLSRRMQLASGSCDPVEPPHPAPWEVPVLAAREGAEATIRQWLEVSCPTAGPGVRELGGHEGETLREVTAWEVNELFAAGDRGAFHATYHGPTGAAAAVVEHHVAGFVDLSDGQVMAATIVRDRLGLERRLKSAGSSP